MKPIPIAAPHTDREGNAYVFVVLVRFAGGPSRLGRRGLVLITDERRPNTLRGSSERRVFPGPLFSKTQPKTKKP